ncbi:MAG: cytochrome-c peroxidase [Gammaproteobacteria bacterium]|jgi:cytochrome c peroxidase|nr:cytochrome-c peroxidase [Gammaproteobacteria bacterium]
MRRMRQLLLLLLIGTAGYFGWMYRPVSPHPWSEADLDTLRSLWFESLPAPPEDLSNAVADDGRAALMGNRLFFDTRMSANGEVSCASCHDPDLEFTDGRHKGRGIGESKRNTRSVVASAYSPWLYWDGRRDSLWSQALSPLEDPNEHGSNRMHIVRFVTTEPTYKSMYAALFGPAPDFADSNRYPSAAAPGNNEELARAWRQMSQQDRQSVNRVFANIGKAIAAYERTLLPERSRFDDYVRAVIDDDRQRQQAVFSNDEVLGLQLFIGAARCTECHNGPLLTNDEFHNTAVLAFPGDLPDRGRIDGVREVIENEFNCLGEYSDDPQHRCPELTFVRTDPELVGAIRTPSLRNLARTGPFMHKGQIDSLAGVLEHYNRAPDAMIGHNEAKPLGLSRPQLRRLEAFLETLAAPSSR